MLPISESNPRSEPKKLPNWQKTMMSCALRLLKLPMRIEASSIHLVKAFALVLDDVAFSSNAPMSFVGGRES